MRMGACRRKRRSLMAKGMNLEYQSFINLTNQIRDELIRIEKGEQATKLFTPVFRKNLRRNGVLLKGGTVTEEAKRVLGIE